MGYLYIFGILRISGRLDNFMVSFLEFAIVCTPLII